MESKLIEKIIKNLYSEFESLSYKCGKNDLNEEQLEMYKSLFYIIFTTSGPYLERLKKGKLIHNNNDKQLLSALTYIVNRLKHEETPSEHENFNNIFLKSETLDVSKEKQINKKIISSTLVSFTNGNFKNIVFECATDMGPNNQNKQQMINFNCLLANKTQKFAIEELIKLITKYPLQ